MTRRERMMAALRCHQPEEACPIWEIEFHLYDRLADRRFIVGREFAALTPAEQERALHANAEIMIDVAQRLHFAALTSIGGYWEVAPGEPAYMWLPDDGPKRFLQILRKTAGPDICVIAESGGTIGMPAAHDYVDFSYQLYDRPEEIDAMAAKRLAASKETIARFADEGVDAVLNCCDVADNHGVFFNPQHLQRFFMPYLNEWADAVQAAGMCSILHTDGNIDTMIDQLAAGSLHAVQALDPTAGMDIVAVKQRVNGRLCLCGNIDLSLFHHGPPEAVYQQTRDVCLACKPGGGFALGASNAVFREVPIDNYLAMIEAWKEYGRYD
ncbi:MAG: hypothetical protein GXY33_04540 [Phycisphaerae bacterium]|nr:hypothetical protein [Phycisphaerae bacterium]